MVLVKDIAPLVLLVALKTLTALLLPRAVPAADVAVRVLAVIKPAPASLIAPVPADNVTLPVVVMLPAFRVMLRPAVTPIAPEVLLTLALMITSLEVPVALSVTVPLPPAVTTAPKVIVPPVAVRLILPLAAAVVVIAPVV